MSLKLEAARVGKKYDKRRKLTDEQRDEIVALKGKVSQRKLAAMYDVSRRLIGFIHNPESAARNYQRRVEAGGSKQYYNKDTWAETMKKHRHYKRALVNEGKIDY